MSESKINDGGPAYPTNATATTHGWYPDGQPCMTHYGSQQGVSIRDYFAAAALQGMLSDGVFDFHVSDKIANDAYELADAMLERRKL